MNKTVAALVAALVFLFPLFVPKAGAEGCLDAIKSRGEIVVGISADFAPFETLDPAKGQPMGFEIDLVTAIAKELGFQVRFVNQGFKTLLDGLQAKQFDIVAAGLTITEERQKAFDFSLPYITGPNTIIVRKELKDINGINGLSDLSGRKVAVLAGSALEKVAKSVVGTEVKPVQQYADAVSLVLTKQAQAMMCQKMIARQFLDKHPDLAIAAEMEAPLGIGMAFRRDCPDLRSKVDAVLEKYQRSGKLAELVAKWFK